MKTNEQGTVLVAVVLFTALAAILAGGLLRQSATQMKLANRTMNMEQALYTAEAGIERAIAYITSGGTVPTSLIGTNGPGRFTVIITATSLLGGLTSTTGTHSVSGSLNINPNNSPDNEFMLLTPDGTVITRDMLQADTTSYTNEPAVYYEGPAIFIHVKPRGNGNQNTLMVDGTVYTLLNSTAYDFSSANMSVRLANDSINNSNGHANGQWWLYDMNGSAVSISEDSSTPSADSIRYSLFSYGTVSDAKRAVIIDGMQRQTWAKYALWYDHSSQIWFITGDVFFGPVHSNGKFWFDGSPDFFGKVTTAATTFGGSTNSVDFYAGFDMGVRSNSMSSIAFTSLLSQADMTLQGKTSIRISGTNMFVCNSRAGLTNACLGVPTNGLLYVRTATSGSNSNADVEVGGTLDGSLTIVAERDIVITNHLTYSVHPTNASNDALGLVAKRNVVIADNAPNNLNIFAHIIATGSSTPTDDTDGMFYVQSYSSGSPRGTLTVFGGIAQDKRGPVGQTSNGTLIHGFYKNYIYDTRFTTDPPPYYPSLFNEYRWETWREQAY